jgi:outer membrane protein
MFVWQLFHQAPPPMKPNLTNLLASVSILTVISLLIYQFAFSSDKIAYVDSSKLMNGYKAMVEVRSEFEKKQKTWQSNIDSLTVDVQEAIKKYEKSAALGTPNEKQLAKDLIGSKQKQLFDYQAAIKQNAGEEEQRLSQNVLTTVNAFLLRYGKKHNYKMIFVTANGNIAYADPGSDISDDIVEQLNKEYTVIGK